MIKAEILVIGSGPGGAITAWESKKKNRDVLLIEAGSNYDQNSCKSYSTEEMEQKYKYGGLTPTFNNPKISYIEGGCLGGGSEVNSGFYHRLPSQIISLWQQKYQIENFEEKDLIKHFETIEKEISVSYIPDNEAIAKASLKLKEGADKLGWENMEVPRWFKFGDNIGGKKQSMTETYLNWYVSNGGKLICDIKTIRLKYLKTYWVAYCIDTKSGEKLQIKAENIFLCCGAIGTPFILRSSGIKNKIGNTLQMHPTIKVVAEFDEEINDYEMGVPVHQVKEFSPDISIGCSISSKPYLALAMLDNDKYLNKVQSNWRKMAIYYAMIRPKGKGKIRKLPFFNDPFITYDINDKDLELLSDGLKKMSTILFSAKAKRIFPSIKNYGMIGSMNDLNLIPKRLSKNSLNLMTIHLFSSCPMGENKKICSTNSYGKVNGFTNLFINDSSLLPSAPGVNPQGTIMVVARRNIHHFLGLN